MRYAYFETIMLVERLHRLYLDVLKYELDCLRIEDISNVQCMILYNVGSGQVTVGELTNRGYYLGSNVSYNLKKMITNGYVVQEPSPHDRRSSRIRLSPKGLQLFDKLDSVISRQINDIEKYGIHVDDMRKVVKTLGDLEAYWESISLKDLRL
jgi:DNA-binding MarR family transcriptional regulator